MPYKLSTDERFFFKHAGYSYDPKKETKYQGRVRCARNLAAAEQVAKRLNWQYEWADDWSSGSHIAEFGEGYDREPETCEWCVLKNEAGKVLESLGCIDDADTNYHRVIEAELASEAMSEYLGIP